MKKKQTYDLIIIGGGSGGLSIAAGAAMLDAKVALIESGKMGGDCLNYGCVPSKSLLAAAKMAYQAEHAGQFGITFDSINIDFPKVMTHVKNVIANIAPHDSIERFSKLGVTVYQNTARFVDKYTVQTGDDILTAKRIVIATGSSPFIPPIDGLKNVNYLTNETIFDLKEKPSHLIVIGGGPIGCELAQAFHFLGCKVTILEAMSILPNDDSDMVELMRKTFLKQGLLINENAKVIKVSETKGQIQIQYEINGSKEEVVGSHVLVATGRRPNVSNLALEKADIDYSPKGIKVNQYLQTSNKKIYALGDVTGAYQFTHVANYHAGIALKNILFRLFSKVSYQALPWVTYTYPELAHAGLTVKQADQQKIKYKVTEFDLSEIDRAQTEKTLNGKIKIISTAKGQVLGVTIIAPLAGELLTPWIMMIREKKTLRSLTDAIIPYPSYSELSKRAASQFYSPMVFSPLMKKLVKFLLKFR